MEYILCLGIGLLIGAVIYRQGIIDGRKVTKEIPITNNPIAPIKKIVAEKKQEKELDEFQEALDEYMSYKGGD